MLNEQIEEISYAIDEMKERNGERWTVKQMESQKKSWRNSLNLYLMRAERMIL